MQIRVQDLEKITLFQRLLLKTPTADGQNGVRESFLLCRKYRSDISGITRKSTAKNLIGEADFLIK